MYDRLFVMTVVVVCGRLMAFPDVEMSRSRSGGSCRNGGRFYFSRRS